MDLCGTYLISKHNAIAPLTVGHEKDVPSAPSIQLEYGIGTA